MARAAEFIERTRGGPRGDLVIGRNHGLPSACGMVCGRRRCAIRCAIAPTASWLVSLRRGLAAPGTVRGAAACLYKQAAEERREPPIDARPARIPATAAAGPYGARIYSVTRRLAADTQRQGRPREPAFADGSSCGDRAWVRGAPHGRRASDRACVAGRAGDRNRGSARQ